MKLCTKCPYFRVLDSKNEDLGCSMPSENITDIVCLLRRILWQLCGIEHAVNEQTDILETDADDDDEEDWKIKT